MKKSFLFLFLSLTVCISSFAKAPLSYIEHGSWACYQDTRFEKEVYRGFMVFNDDETNTSSVILTVNTNPTKKSSVISFGIDVAWDSNNMPTIAGIYDVSNFKKEYITDKVIFQSVADIMNFDSVYRVNIKKIGYDTIIDDVWSDTLVQKFHFNKALPCFKFDSVQLKGSAKPYIIMDKFGLAINESDVTNFANKTKWNYKIPEEDYVFTYDKAKAKKVKLENISLNLDENWEASKGANLDVNGYLLKEHSPQDAIIFVEDLSKYVVPKTEEEMIKVAFSIITSPDEDIVPLSVQSKYDKKTLYVSYITYDSEQDLATRGITKILNNGKIIRLFCFDKCYLDNKQYFDKIIETAK